MYEDFLPLVQKPARYINSEINAIRKDWSRVKTKICLFFPDTYEVGMSHIGLRILYDILNGRDDTACERVFSPWTDYEAKLRAAGARLKSLESNVPLADFDIVGVTLQYELSYTNFLAGLDLAGIPLQSRDRTEKSPIVIAGGPCAVNPEPLADFIDVFFVGEAEEAVHELIEMKQQHRGRRQFLEAAAVREGFYVPAFGPVAVRRRHVRNLESALYPSRPLLPLLKPVHDRITVEVARGCIRGCRFCQAGVIYRPFRERSPERVRSLLHESLACTGYEELSLASLSSGDYSAIEPLITDLLERYRDSRVSVSLPSLRVGTLTPAMIEAIAGTRKTGFTLAPEAGTERLRRVINKPVSDRDLLDAAETIFANGWNVLKLYFMIGLPTETDEDLDGIIRLGNLLLAQGKRFSKRHVQINISVSTFVPKPHTPFQWIGQERPEGIRRKQSYLKAGLRKRGINLKLHDSQTSLLEAAFARGDRSMGRVLEEAFLRGCRFDGWSESFNFQKWTDAFAAVGMDPAVCATRTFSLDQPLPWEHVKTGVTKKFLLDEYRRASAGEITENCRVACAQCGMGCKDGGTAGFGRVVVADPEDRPRPALGGPQKTSAIPEITTRIRMKFSKTGRVRYLSHLDFMTFFHRAVVRAGLPVAFSQGFNPHPKIAFGPALPVGIEGLSEYVDMETDPFTDPAEIKKRLNAALPDGIHIHEVLVIPRKADSLSAAVGRYEYATRVPERWTAGIEDRVERFLSRSSVVVAREHSSKDIRACIESIKVARREGQTTLSIMLQDKDNIKPRIQDVLAQCFEIGQDEALLFGTTRTAVYYRDQETWKSPLDI